MRATVTGVKYTRVVTSSIIALTLLAGCAANPVSGGGAGGLIVEKFATLPEVQPGDEFSVHITINGYSLTVPEVIPFDAVLIIDRSGSMQGQPYSSAKQAATNFVNLSETASTSASAIGQIRVGIVAFGDNASVIRGLTSDYAMLRQDISNLPSPGGLTNIQQAMELAHTILQGGTSAVRIAILLTDGRPAPNSNAQSLVIAGTLVPEAQQNSYRYYTIGLGPDADNALLLLIANATGGEYHAAPQPAGLQGIYSVVFNHVAHTVLAGQIVLQERLNTSVVEFIPNSFAVDPDLSMPSLADLTTFRNTGAIDIPMGELPSNRLHTISFRVQTKNCLEVDAPQEFTTIYPDQSTAKAVYILGQVPAEEFLPVVGLKCYPPGALRIEKTFDRVTKEVTIKLKSNFVATTAVDKTIRDINVYEYPSIHYQYESGTATPAPDRVIPAGNVDLLYWHIPTLAPQQEQILKFNVQTRAYIPRDGTPLHVDAQKARDGIDASIDYLLPDGTTQRARLPQVQVVVYILETVSGGRPDLFVTPGFDIDELATLGLNPYDPVTDPSIPIGGPASAWPLSTNVLRRWESPYIWIDSEASNGFVSNWNDAQDVQSHIDNAVFDPLLPTNLRRIAAQGDLFSQGAVNRVYVLIDNTGLGDSVAIVDGIELYALNNTSGIWDLLETQNLPIILGNTTGRIMIELPASALQSAYLTQFGPQAWNVWTAELRVDIAISADEKHTNNNSSTERVEVV